VSTRGPVLIVGTGLLGTSLALALRTAGVEVLLSDTSPTSLALARDMGAGSLHDEDSPEPQIVVVATPPDVTADVVVAQLSAHPSAVVTDVASVKERVVAEVRANVLLSGPVAELYMGSLRSNLMGPNARPLEPRTVRDQVADVLALGGEFQEAMAEPAGPYPADSRLLRALDVADGCDVVSSVVGGLDGWVAERGRSLSGGQRQRVALARALAVDPAVLVLVEPTSAVDSHTEARIAGRLAAFRRGRTSVVVTGSPLVLAVCDEVVFVVGGVPVLRGSHRQLLADPAYQATVHRGEGA